MSVLRIVQFTDPHLYGSENESLRGVPTLPALRAALAHARARDWPPHALLVTGDIVQDDPGGYSHFRRVFAGLGLPVLCLPGNHDEPEAMRRELAGEPFVLGDFFDIGHAHRHTGVAGVGALHGVHGERTDGVGEIAACSHATLWDGR